MSEPARSKQAEQNLIRLGEAYLKGGRAALLDEWNRTFHPSESKPLQIGTLDPPGMPVEFDDETKREILETRLRWKKEGFLEKEGLVEAQE